MIVASKLFLVIISLLSASMLGVSPKSSFAQSGVEQSEEFSPDSKPFGKTYGEWTAEWWDWFISMPTDRNPIADPTGERCAEGQNGPVWFLVSSGGGKSERSCPIPADKAILASAINVECSFAEDDSLKTEDDLRACANSDQDLVTQHEAKLDGSELEVSRVESPLFDVSFPDDNVFAAPAGPSQAVSDGYWVFLKPLMPGEHELHTQGLLVDYTTTGPVNLVEDSTYHLTVEASSSPSYAETVAFSGKSFDFPVSSPSTVSNFRFDEQARQLSFRVSGGAGTTSMPLSWLLEDPYTVMINNTRVADYNTSENPESGETILSIFHGDGSHDVVITGTSVVPEFSSVIFILLATIGVVLILSKSRLLSYGKLNLGNS